MLYCDHIAECNQYAQRGPAELRRACLFVLATIQQQLETVPAIVTAFESEGSASGFAFGSKAKGIDWLDKYGDTLYKLAMRQRTNAEALLGTFLQVPGLGLVKAGFLCQIFADHVGCLDTHNIKLYDISLTALRYGYKARELTQAKQKRRYIDLCAGLGGSAALWSRWCDYVATMRPYNWVNGREVSQFHVDTITGKETGAIVDLFSGIDYEPRFKESR